MSKEEPRILIVDDERLNIDVLNGLLRDTYTIMVAMNGKQALQAAQSKYRPDLILLDIMMPEMDGYEVCRQLKADEATRDIPVIFVTAMSSGDDEAKGFDVGAVDYIAKPIKPIVTMARIKTHLELKSQRDYLSSLSIRDGLTGVANRHRFDVYLESEHQKAMAAQSPLSLIMIDIDYFKPYNDYHGYLVGDDVLKLVATTINSKMNNPKYLTARFGGVIFFCVLPDTEHNKMVSIGEVILDAVRALNIPHELSTVSDMLTISMGGITFVPQSDSQTEDAIAAVEDKLYRSKELGRNQMVN